ncbi:hypothetical protein Nepgr_016808 [Nepenthes gracilis]|uniref:BHLH domain-containing protein n=1 Tax=Nepenthes gracilis TaxID=150966 RepID=A0AAD3XRM4_NEPGR|nr:hypothetical protein Nepgr_016808 [Nepenthes gracilis]
MENKLGAWDHLGMAMEDHDHRHNIFPARDDHHLPFSDSAWPPHYPSYEPTLQPIATSCFNIGERITLPPMQMEAVIEEEKPLQEPEEDHEEDEEDGEEEELGAMKEMMYKIAAMQPVDIDPASIRKPKRRNVRISDDPQSVAARHRRERISEKIRILQRLVPGGTKMDTASMLEEAIRYVKFLKKQIRLLQSNQRHHLQPYLNGWPAAMGGSNSAAVEGHGREGFTMASSSGGEPLYMLN